jgi:hypothetical protein
MPIPIGTPVAGGVAVPVGGAPRYGTVQPRVTAAGEIADQYGVVGERLSIPCQFAGTGDYALTVYKGSLPPGVILTDSRIKGVPSAEWSSRLLIMATDPSGRRAQSNPFNLTVNNPVGAPSSAFTYRLTQSEAYTLTLFPEQAGRAPYRWSIASGSLPTGLTLATDGTISGTPTTVESQDVTFTVVDANGTTDTSATLTFDVTSYDITEGRVTIASSGYLDERMAYVFADNGSGFMTLYLPADTSGPITIKKLGSAGLVIITRQGSDTIEGASTTVSISTQYQYRTFVKQDGVWWIVAGV